MQVAHYTAGSLKNPHGSYFYNDWDKKVKTMHNLKRNKLESVRKVCK